LKDEALGLFVVLLQMFAEVTYQGRPFNKLVVFDEAHKYIDSPDLVAGLVEVVREMRHKGTSILVASQDPPSVPTSLIELSSQVILHKFNSPNWLKHIQKANAALDTWRRTTTNATTRAMPWSSALEPRHERPREGPAARAVGATRQIPVPQLTPNRLPESDPQLLPIPHDVRDATLSSIRKPIAPRAGVVRQQGLVLGSSELRYTDRRTSGRALGTGSGHRDRAPSELVSDARGRRLR
jgi:hypothetical protein